MRGMARRRDSATSHSAARLFVDGGHQGRCAVEARRLVKKYRGYTYQHLWDRHRVECFRKNIPVIFSDPPSLMRRLSEEATRAGHKKCPITGRSAGRWYPRGEK